jgi:Cu/Ag efflux pump CusA
MTSAAMVLGMIPTAIGTGVGSEFRAPMATAVIGGVISSTLLTVLDLPHAARPAGEHGGVVRAGHPPVHRDGPGDRGDVGRRRGADRR